MRESRETTSLIASAILIGLLAGLAAVGFDRIVHYSETLIRQFEASEGTFWSMVTTLLIPAAGALIVTPIVLHWAPDVRGSGVPNVMFAVSNLGGRLAKRIVIWRPIASAIAIGTGAPLGTEGPVVQLSAAIASATGSFMRLSESRRRNLLAVAAAGGISATFNAPIAGMLFALEVILGQFGSRYVASVVIGSVTASVVSRRFLGPDPAFAVRNYTLGSAWELPLYFVLAILAGFVGVGLIRVMTAADDLFDRLRVRPWLRPATGGLVVGLLALLVPQVLGRGYETTGSILQGDPFTVWLLLGIVVAKTLATSVALAAWLPGGVFAPLLMIGAALGGAFGTVAQQQLPHLALQPGAFALVGMSAVFSAAERAPMSTIILVFEMSGDYQLILPLLLSTVVSMLVSELIQDESIYRVMLTRRGLSLQRHRSTDLLETVQVSEVMHTEADVLLSSDTLAEAEKRLDDGDLEIIAVVEPGDSRKLSGIITRTDLEKARQAELPAETPVSKAATHTVQVVLPDDPISEVLERMAQYHYSRLPVVDSRDRMRLIGMVRQGDVARAYYRAVQRERSIEQAGERRRLRDLTGQEIIEIQVPSDSRLSGKTLREAALPQWCVIVAIRRKGATIFPHGETRLESGDRVVANVAPGHEADFRSCFARR